MQDRVTDIFFDLDHTLWDFEKNSALAFHEVFSKHSLPINLPHFLSIYEPINTSYWALYREGKITQPQLRYRRLKDSFDALDYPVEDDQVFALSDDYIFFLPQFNHLVDYGREILNYLHKKYRLHIITNGFAQVQHLKLENAQIEVFFQSVTDSETAGVKKPHPAIFEYALNKANAKAFESLMIGDCIDADVRGAINCGMKAILFHQQQHEDQSICQINHLKQLEQLL